MASKGRLAGLSVLLGVGGLGLVAGVDALAAYAGARDDLVWMVAMPVVLLVAVALSGGWAWRRTNGDWKFTLVAGTLAAVTFGISWYILMLVALSRTATMILQPVILVQGLPTSPIG